MPLRMFYFIFKDQALPANRPRGVAERLSYSVCAFGLRRAGCTKARLVWVQESPSASQRMQKFPKCKLHKDLGTLLQNAASLTSIHGCCGASGIPRISTVLPSQIFWHMGGFENMAVLCDPS